LPRTALVIDEAYGEHRAAPGHPERADRIRALLPFAQEPGLLRVAPRPATREEILAVHAEAHWTAVADSAGRPFTFYDLDTSAGPRSFETALLASGGVLELADAVASGHADNGFAAVRPPGHHAESDRVLGFCLFNHVAVAARHLQRVHGMERIAVLDFDAHHGNGTQEIFWEDPDVLYVSLHEHPFYPGTGSAAERGGGAGEGATVNLPLAAGSGDAEVLDALRTAALPAVRSFAPDFLLLSAGFDAHRADPLANLEMTDAGFTDVGRAVMDAAADCCGGRVAAVLEGGYDLPALRASFRAFLDEMRGVTTREEEAA
jgi:acetoin utilization deacetylase AcuC-like enzyme